MNMFKFKNELIKDYEIVNQSRDNRSGFVHESTVFYHGVAVITNKVQYHNRTWECYEFQSSMSGAIHKLLDMRTDRITKQFKQQNNIKRLTEKTRKQLENLMQNDEAYKEYKLMLKEIRGY